MTAGNHTPPAKRRAKLAILGPAIGGIIIGAIIGGAASSGKIKTVAGPVTTVTATPTIERVVATRTTVITRTYTPPPPKQFGAGTYVVGTDIQPGTYRTAGSSDCYWARLSSLNTSDIIDNNLGPGPQTVQVLATDKAFTVAGSCTFGRAG